MTRAVLVLAVALLAGCNQHDAALEVRIEMLEEEQIPDAGMPCIWYV